MPDDTEKQILQLKLDLARERVARIEAQFRAAQAESLVLQQQHKEATAELQATEEATKIKE